MMWTYRLGLERSKRLLLTGDALDGRRAAEWGLASEAVPEAELDAAALALAERVAQLPRNQLHMMKLLVNHVSSRWACRRTQLVGTLLDGAARHTPEGDRLLASARWRTSAATVRERDAPFGDYGEGPRIGVSDPAPLGARAGRRARRRGWAARRRRREVRRAAAARLAASTRCARRVDEVVVIAKPATPLPPLRRAASGATSPPDFHPRHGHRRGAARAPTGGRCVVVAVRHAARAARAARDAARRRARRRRPGGRRARRGASSRCAPATTPTALAGSRAPTRRAADARHVERARPACSTSTAAAAQRQHPRRPRGRGAPAQPPIADIERARLHEAGLVDAVLELLAPDGVADRSRSSSSSLAPGAQRRRAGRSRRARTGTCAAARRRSGGCGRSRRRTARRPG